MKKYVVESKEAFAWPAHNVSIVPGKQTVSIPDAVLPFLRPWVETGRMTCVELPGAPKVRGERGGSTADLEAALEAASEEIAALREQVSALEARLGAPVEPSVADLEAMLEAAYAKERPKRDNTKSTAGAPAPAATPKVPAGAKPA